VSNALWLWLGSSDAGWCVQTDDLPGVHLSTWAVFSLQIDVKIAALCSHGIDGGALSGMSESDVVQ